MEVFEAANLINIGRFDAVIGQNMKTREPGIPGIFFIFCPETREWKKSGISRTLNSKTAKK